MTAIAQALQALNFTMHITKQQEQFSLAYLGAIASVAGYGIEEVRCDIDSVDASIRQYGFDDSGLPIMDTLRVQLKCTFAQVPKAESLHFRLKAKNYNDLRRDTVYPRILVVVHIPENANGWYSSDTNSAILRHCAYWLSLRGYPTITEQSKTVELPVSQRLTVAELTRLMNLIAHGKQP